MRKFLKYFVLGLILLLVGMAIGFHVPPESVIFSVVALDAEKDSIWDLTGAGGPLGERNVVTLIVRDATPQRDLTVVKYFEKNLSAALEKNGIQVVDRYPNQLLVEIKNFSTKKLLGSFSIKSSANEVAREVKKILNI